ncbi:MAG: glutamyl-tRNA synthetase [Planctomycetota bacterium]|jgi:glutamyl-tRNA synthetase
MEADPSPTPTVRGRLAPSPTGRMHIGHARSFLLAWWSVRSQGGELLLRIEDLEPDRARQEWADGILEDLRWIGLDWDGEVVMQSEQMQHSFQARDRLIQSGHAYACVCSRKEVREAASAPHEGLARTRGEVNYPGTCRGMYPSLEDAEQQTGRKAALRFRVPDKPVRVVDGIHGELDFHLPDHGGDFVIQRRDGLPAYQLGVAVDDARSGINEVLRGDDLLVSAARQQLIYEALELACPAWIHVPLVVDPDGGRLAKRSGSTSLAELREEGMQADQIIAWVAKSSGMQTSAGASASDLIDEFELTKIPHQAATWPQPF